YKPKMDEMFDKDLPESVRQGQRLTTMTSGQARFPIAPSKYKFAQYGKAGTWVSELLPWTAKIVDELAIIKTVWTEAINHDPAVFTSNPPGVSTETRRRMLDSLARMNQKQLDELADPETQARIAQYEMAYRMQTSVPELMDLSQEPKNVLDMYGPDVHKPGT